MDDGADVIQLDPDRVKELASSLGKVRGIEINLDTGEVTSDGSPTATKTLEELADETYVSPLLPGTEVQLTLNVGGRKPNGSTLKTKSAEVPVTGQFAKNSKVKLVVDGEVEEIHFKTVRDGKGGPVLGHDRVHVLEIDRIERPANPAHLDAALRLCERWAEDPTDPCEDIRQEVVDAA